MLLVLGVVEVGLESPPEGCLPRAEQGFQNTDQAPMQLGLAYGLFSYLD